MNNIEQYDTLIEKFLAGQMTSEEVISFKHELSTNAELRDHAKVVSSLIKGLRRQKKEEDEEIVNKNSTSEHTTTGINLRSGIALPNGKTAGHPGYAASIVVPRKPIRNAVIKFLAIPLSVAAACILIFNIYGNSRNNCNEIFVQYYCDYNNDEMARGEEDSVTLKELTTLFNEIDDSKDCTEIIHALESIYWNLDKEYTYRPYSTDIAWYLALAYIKNRQISEATSVLCKLESDNPDTELAETCNNLLKEIKKIH